LKQKHGKKPKNTAIPPLKTTAPGTWIPLTAGDSQAASGGGRRSVTTEVMVAPGGKGWVMRTIVASAEGSPAVALCYIPKR
jgi:hypothetical protein